MSFAASADGGRRIAILHDASRQEDELANRRVSRLADRLGLPIADAVPAGGAALAWHEDRLELRSAEDRPGRGVRVDAEWVLREARRGGNALRGDPLARAVGPAPQRIVDATAGLGGDTLLLAALGHSVIAFERHPVVHALLEDGLAELGRRDEAMAIVARIALHATSAVERLAAVEPRPDVVLLDPMFREDGAAGGRRRGSALPPKSMQRLRLVVGEDADDVELLAISRAVALRRVVVKRADGMAPLGEARPSWSIGGTTIRYDVYVGERG